MITSTYNNIWSSTITIFMELFNTDLAFIIKTGVYLYKRALTSNPIPQHVSYFRRTLVHNDLSIFQTICIFLSLVALKITLEVVVLIIKSTGVLVIDWINLLLLLLLRPPRLVDTWKKARVSDTKSSLITCTKLISLLVLYQWTLIHLIVRRDSHAAVAKVKISSYIAYYSLNHTYVAFSQN